MPRTACSRSVKTSRPVVTNVPEANYVADLIRRYMKAQRLTTDDLGARLHCTGANVRLKLLRPIGKWTVTDIRMLCDAVNCPADEAYQLLPK